MFLVFSSLCALTLRYFIISFAACQVFFWSFFNFLFHLTSSSPQPFGYQFLFSNSLDIVSCTRLFVKYFFCFFSTSFDISFFKVFYHSTFSTASVFYHAVYCLSRSFLNFLNYLFYLNFQNNSFICFVSDSLVSITSLFLFVNYFFYFFKSHSYLTWYFTNLVQFHFN